MEISMKGYTNTPILNSNVILMHANDSNLRLFHVQRAVSNTPLNEVKGSWKLSSPQSASTFSAVGFQFAQKLQKILGVPVGIIEAAWGGTPIKGWMSKKSLEPFPQINIPSVNTKVKASSQHPTCLFNGMINPIVGYGIKGFIWYQGEWDRRDPYLYKGLMVNMIKGWRALWKRGPLPFYYVQIAPYDYKGALQDSVPYVREAQARVMKTLPHVGMAVSMDVGNKYTIHPPDKTTIARRLIYWALVDAYHWKGIAYESPSFQSMKINGSRVTVSFNHALHGLTSFDHKINGFELAGKNKVFYPAEAKIKGSEKVVLHSDEVPHPVAARYLFKDWVDAHLYNTEGLPVAPFRTDNW
jgi:sialate O-acetylesterase